jgi:hypothetical protein
MSRKPRTALTGSPAAVVTECAGMPWKARKYMLAESTSSSGRVTGVSLPCRCDSRGRRATIGG